MPKRDRAKKYEFILTVEDVQPGVKVPGDRFLKAFNDFNSKVKKSEIVQYLVLVPTNLAPHGDVYKIYVGLSEQ